MKSTTLRFPSSLFLCFLFTLCFSVMGFSNSFAQAGLKKTRINIGANSKLFMKTNNLHSSYITVSISSVPDTQVGEQVTITGEISDVYLGTLDQRSEVRITGKLLNSSSILSPQTTLIEPDQEVLSQNYSQRIELTVSDFSCVEEGITVLVWKFKTFTTDHQGNPLTEELELPVPVTCIGGNSDHFTTVGETVTRVIENREVNGDKSKSAVVNIDIEPVPNIAVGSNVPVSGVMSYENRDFTLQPIIHVEGTSSALGPVLQKISHGPIPSGDLKMQAPQALNMVQFKCIHDGITLIQWEFEISPYLLGNNQPQPGQSTMNYIPVNCIGESASTEQGYLISPLDKYYALYEGGELLKIALSPFYQEVEYSLTVKELLPFGEEQEPSIEVGLQGHTLWVVPSQKAVLAIQLTVVYGDQVQSESTVVQVFPSGVSGETNKESVNKMD